MDVARRCWMVLEGCEVSWHSLELKEVMWPLGGQATQRRCLVEILKRTKAILSLSKYAPLWPCCLLLSTDLHNVPSLHRRYKLLILVGAPFTQGTVSIIPIGGSISPEGFLPSILLLVVIIVTVLIVAVILVVVVIAIVGVVIVVVFIGIVVVIGGVSSIFKLSFMIIDFLRIIVFYYLLHQPLGYGNGFLQSLRLRSGWAYVFHQDKASSVRVRVANVTLFSSAHFLRENTDSVRSNQSSSKSSVPVGITSTCHCCSLCFQSRGDTVSN
ncbi:hypothetical protein Tco_1111111 [Tanacetum coccineum]|uniref:Uncharacterized protein n=1 Tax=Tanacetum coccineum TaxID=301880 RepID=A0ABQ5IKP0_9ASTR